MADVARVTLEDFAVKPYDSKVQVVELTFKMENISKEPIKYPFCGEDGDNGMLVIDAEGREFVGDGAPEGEEANCRILNPGFSDGPYLGTFLVPMDAQIAQVKAWVNFNYEETPVSWSVQP